MSAAETLDQLDSDLDEFITDDLPTYDDESEPPTLADVDQADRALRRIARLDHQLARLQKLADARIEQIKAWHNERARILLNERAWWERSAEGWMRAHHEATGTKTEKLPSGTLQLRKAKTRVEPLEKEPPEHIGDPFVRIKREWDKRSIADTCEPGPGADDVDVPEGYEAHRAVTADGEPLPGVVLLVPTRPSFSLSTGEG